MAHRVITGWCVNGDVVDYRTGNVVMILPIYRSKLAARRLGIDNAKVVYKKVRITVELLPGHKTTV